MGKMFFENSFNEYKATFYGIARSLEEDYRIPTNAVCKINKNREIYSLVIDDQIDEGSFADVVRELISMLNFSLPGSTVLEVRDKNKQFIAVRRTRGTEGAKKEVVDYFNIKNVTDEKPASRGVSAKENLTKLIWQMQSVNRNPFETVFINKEIENVEELV